MNASSVAELPRVPTNVVRAGTADSARQTTAILLLITLVAGLLRFWDIGHQSFWYDEGLTIMEIHHALGRMLGLLPRVESNPPVYATLAWGWARIFGFGAAGVRSLSAVAGLITVPALYGIGARFVSRRAGLIAAALAAFNPLLIWYSQEARSYSLVVMFAALSWLAFAEIRARGPSARRLAAWAVAAALTVATHYYGVVAVLPQALWLLGLHRRALGAWLAVAAVGAVGLALAPLAVSQGQLGSWISTYPLGRRLTQMAPQALLGTGAPARDWLKLAGALAVLLSIGLLIARAGAAERRGTLLAGAAALGGFVLSLLFVLAGVDDLITRNVIVLMIPLIVFVSGGLAAARWAGTAGVATLCAVGLIAAAGVVANWKLQRADWRDVARSLTAEPAPAGGRAILVQREAGLYPLAVYLPGLRFMKPSGARVSELDVIAAGNGTKGAWFCWWGAACNLVPTRLDAGLRVPGFAPAGPVLHIKQFSVLRLRAARALPLPLHLLARATNRTGLYVYWVYDEPSA